MFVKMKINGFYEGIAFKKKDIVEYDEDEVKGLDPEDYSIVRDPGDAEVKTNPDKKKGVKGAPNKQVKGAPNSK